MACAGGAWLVGEAGLADTDTVVLRVLTAAAAVAAVTGAVLLRRWDRKAGRRVSELQARRASAEWRAEEQQAEAEAALEEARAQRAALEKKLTARRAELGRLRNEHAALLRRYANAETQRASALEGRRRLEIEAAEPTRALTAGATDHRSAAGAPTSLTYLQAREALRHLKRSAERQRRLRAIEAGDDAGIPGHRSAPHAADAPARRTAGEVANTRESRSTALPGLAATPVSPRAAAGRRLGGGFDFFGSRKSATTAPGQRSGPGRPHRGEQGQDAAADDAEADPERATTAPEPGASEPVEPEPGIPVRRTGPVGKVVELGADEEALDIAELRGAIS